MNVPAEQLSPFSGDHREITSTTAQGMLRRGEPGAPRAPPPQLLEGYLPEAELCEQLNIIIRTARKWRQTGEGPPFVKIGQAVFYPIAGFRKWLEKRVRQAPRGR